MRRLVLVAILASLVFGRFAAAQRQVSRRQPGTMCRRRSAGWSEAALADVQDWSKQIHSTAVMVVHRGAVVAEWGDTAKRTELASVRKSLLSALIGIAVAERKISLDSTLAQLGIDDNAPALTEVEKQATVRMLLEARSGVYHPALYETPAMARQRPARGSHAPGTFWYYNNWDFNALGTIYEQATGTGIFDALDRLIARPIGMQDYRPQDGVYFPGADFDPSRLPDPHERARPCAVRVAVSATRAPGLESRSCRPTGSAKARVPTRCNPAPGSATAISGGPRRRRRCRMEFPKGTFIAWGAGGQHAFVVPACDLVVVNRVDRDQRLPEPKLSEVKQLLNLTLKAGPFGR